LFNSYSKKKEAIEAEHVAELARRAAEQEEAQKTAALARAKARATDAEWRASIARRRHVKFAEASTKLEVSIYFSFLTVCPYSILNYLCFCFRLVYFRNRKE
jgi:hypothetical protein